MRYLSVCSGIEAASVAWNPLGWEAAAFAEIAPFPSAVLAHHYPSVPNLGDFTTITLAQLNDIGPVRIVVGGTPCQSFSIAGLRQGLDDPRGNLALGFLRLVDLARPEWVVWENVPGVLSSGGGRDFGTFLGALGQLGYGFAYRVLDAQYFGVAQRRRRVFVTGHLGDWRPAAAVLFERDCLSGNPAPSRAAGARAAGRPEDGPRGSGRRALGCDAGHAHYAAAEVCGTLSPGAHPGGFNGQDAYTGQMIAHTLRADGFDASEDGNGRGTPLVPVAFDWQSGGDVRHNVSEHHTSALQACQTPAVLAFDTTQVTSAANRSNPKPGDPCHPLAAGAHAPAIRRITPREAERLQGFRRPGDPRPDYTLIPGWEHKPTRKDHADMVRYLIESGYSPAEADALARTPDGPRYHALGNSMCVDVMEWIGRRIALVESITATGKVVA